MVEKRYNVIVIGSGPASEVAAIKATKVGKSVAMIEEYFFVVGVCNHWGTIRSKSLRQGVQRLVEFNNNP